MQEKENKEFQIRVNDVSALLDQLLIWNITPDNNERGFAFKIQSNNVVYNIQVNIIERFTVEEQLFMLNLYPHIKTFEDIQMKIFNKVIWNWRDK